MTTTTMHFGPEWMRTKQTPAARQATVPPSPTVVSSSNSIINNAPTPPGATSYSALVTPQAPPQEDKRDLAHPFKYSKAEMLRVWKEGGGRGTLPIEVERWEGVVKEASGEPVGLREMTEAEKKLFATSVNSEMRRRQSTDYAAQGDRPNLKHSASGGGGLSGEGYSSLMGRRRRGDSSGADHPPLNLLSRKQSWSSVSGPLASPSMPSPRTRIGSHGSGFDGILNSGETQWGPKRRVASTGGTFGTRGDPDPDAQRDDKPSEIKEEEEEAQEGEGLGKTPDGSFVSNGTGVHVNGDTHTETESSVDLAAVQNSLNELNINKDRGSPAQGNGDTTQQPFVDPMSEYLQFKDVPWSYLDPSGNLQGPFPGETMQSWNDQSYFTDDLRVKRTDIDADWITVADLKRLARGPQIFLCTLNEASAPPGLSRQLSSFSPAQGAGSVFDSPFQPTPQHTSAAANFDSYLHTGSTSSPASSFGNGSFARGSISPDPVIVGGRLGSHNYPADMSYANRPEAGFGARSSYNDMAATTPYNPTSMSNLPWQTTHHDGAVLDGLNPAAFDPAMGYVNNIAGSADYQSLSFNIQNIAEQDGQMSQAGNLYLGGGYAGGGATYQQGLAASGNMIQQDYSMGMTAGLNGSPFPVHDQPQQVQPLMPINTSFGPDYSTGAAMSPAAQPLSHPTRAGSISRSPWAQPTKPRPFDADHPTVHNTFVRPPSPVRVSPWGQLQSATPSSAVESGSPWLQTANGAHAFGAEEPSTQLTFDHLAQHNQLQQDAVLDNAPVVHDSPAVVETPLPPAPQPMSPLPLDEVSAPAPVPPTAPPKEPAPPTKSSKKRRASSTQQAKEEPTPATVTSPVSPSAPNTQISIAVNNKSPPWGVQPDESKPKKTTIGLREIQEAEKKKQEAKRAAELEKERQARAATAAAATAAASAQASEPVQSFTTSWGLPTSQVGARANSSNNIHSAAMGKDGATAGAIASSSSATSPPAPGATTPVWTNANTAVKKKTMKEIQEEEERRKKTAKQETMAAAAKRAADSIVKTTTVPSASVGGAWTTVGAGGKPVPSPAALAPPVRPSVSAQPSYMSPAPQVSPARPAQANGSAVPRAQSASQVVAKSLPQAKSDDEPVTPSPDFLKWLRDSLRGLNTGVQFEDIAQMLLSFPLDPDPSTVELITETVYGASTTLDGRRFAAEFVAKRKVDAANRPRGQSSAGGKPASLADVVKTQPKPAGNEWGGYKVVRKKGKSARS